MSVVLSAEKNSGSGTHLEPHINYGIDVDGFSVAGKATTSLDQSRLVVGTSEKGEMEEALARSCILHSDKVLPEKLSDQLMDAIG